jgi:hypothetical protein
MRHNGVVAIGEVRKKTTATTPTRTHMDAIEKPFFQAKQNAYLQYLCKNH